MNSYTFVPKLQDLSSNHPCSSLMQRLQQLKASMHPPSQQQYSSVQPNSNPDHQYGSAAQNQRLFQYLPKETQQPFPSKQNQQGLQEYESYRKSLEKKLNYLFEKEKQVMRTQGTYEQLKGREEAKKQQRQGYGGKGESHKRQYTEELQRKYSQLKQQQKAINHQRIQQHPHNPPTLSPQTSDHRQYKIHSTIQSNYYQKPLPHIHRDSQIDQMQRKIKILEMKYLGGYSQEIKCSNLYEVEKIKGQRIARSGVSEIFQKNNGKMHKVRTRKERTSPDRLKNKYNISKNQTIQPINTQSKQQKLVKPTKLTKNQPLSPLKHKHPIKDYMTTIQPQAIQQNQKNLPQTTSQLHKQFNQLKGQFHTLLQISKSMIEKVQINEQQKLAKRDKKHRAKAMLKQIILRLDEIKQEIHLQKGTGQKTVKNNQFMGMRTKAKSESEPRFQKSSNKTLEKKTIERRDILEAKDGFSGHKQSRTQNQAQIEVNQNQFSRQKANQIDKLKKLLTLQVEHRQLVQRKLEVICGNDKLGPNQ